MLRHCAITSPRTALTCASALATQSATSPMLASAAVSYSSCSTNQATRHGRPRSHCCNSRLPACTRLRRPSLTVTPDREPAATQLAQTATQRKTATVIRGGRAVRVVHPVTVGHPPGVRAARRRSRWSAPPDERPGLVAGGVLGSSWPAGTGCPFSLPGRLRREAWARARSISEPEAPPEASSSWPGLRREDGAGPGDAGLFSPCALPPRSVTAGTHDHCVLVTAQDVTDCRRPAVIAGGWCERRNRTVRIARSRGADRGGPLLRLAAAGGLAPGPFGINNPEVLAVTVVTAGRPALRAARIATLWHRGPGVLSSVRTRGAGAGSGARGAGRAVRVSGGPGGQLGVDGGDLRLDRRAGW